jgi:hypothetical protein
MYTVEIDLGGSDLREQMNEMREWLDERRFEPTLFNWDRNGGGMLLSVAFKATEEARAFANRVAGRLIDVRAGVPNRSDRP